MFGADVQLVGGTVVDPLAGTGGTYPTSRADSPASQLADRTGQGSAGGITSLANQNLSAESAARFSKFLGFGSNYDFNYKVFPSDLGSEQYNHYMVINVNVQTTTNITGQTKVDTSLSQSGNSFGPSNFKAYLNEASTVDQLRYQDLTGNAQNRFNSFIDNFRQGFSNLGQGNFLEGATNLIDSADAASSLLPSDVYVPRNTRRIDQAIALFMPTPVTYTQQNVYEEISLSSFGFQAGKLGVSLGAALAQGTRGTNPSRAQIGNPYGELIRQGFSLVGRPINPKLEVLFSHTPQRSFAMEFLMAPKSEEESKTVKNIIDTFRFHAAPEITGSLGIVPTFIPPAEFDIQFYHKGKPNDKIPKINTCALERIEVDYAPAGVYSTFSNGYPVAIRLSLAFRELEILHKKRVQQGY